MMKSKSYDKKFKSKVALDAIKGELTIQELAKCIMNDVAWLFVISASIYSGFLNSITNQKASILASNIN